MDYNCPVERNFLSDSNYDHLWFCQLCDKKYVVPALARACEEKHFRENSVQ